MLKMLKNPIKHTAGALVLLLALCSLSYCKKGDEEKPAPTPTTTYTVTFDVDGGSAVPEQTVNNGAKATRPNPNPAKAGYTFDNWYQDAAKTIAFDFSTQTITAATTIYAKWTAGAASTYTVTFTLGGTGLASRAVTVNNGEKVKAPTDYPQATDTYSVGTYSGGKYILVWYTDAALTQQYDLNATAVTGDITLYGKWKVQPQTKDELQNLVDASIAVKGDTVDLNFIDTALITDMSSLFEGKRSFNGAISEWDVANVTDMQGMFSGARAFNQPIGTWHVANVTNMGFMFAYAYAFNQPINEWDVANVTNMRAMFVLASAFNQPIGTWDVSKVTNMQNMFDSASAFNQPIGGWKVANVTNMGNMFYGASAFNQPIGGWDVSNVTNMRGMFFGASAFNQPIGTWDVSRVTDMRGMFSGAAAFNQDLSPWKVANVEYCEDFSNAPVERWPLSSRPATPCQ